MTCLRKSALTLSVTFLGHPVQRNGNDLDPQGLVLSVVDRFGFQTNFTHSGELLTRVEWPTLYAIDLAYDGNGRLQSISDSAGRTTNFGLTSQ